MTTYSYTMVRRIALAGRIRISDGDDGRTADLSGLGRAGRVALGSLVRERGRPVFHDELA